MTANRKKFSKQNFIHTHDQSHQEDTPYDAFIVNRVNNNNEYLYEADGNVVSCNLSGFYDAADQPLNGQFERPFSMMSQWASIIQIPWLVQPGLSKIIVSLEYRVSTLSLNAGSPAKQPAQVNAYLKLSNHSGISNLVQFQPTGSTPRFVWAGDNSGQELVFDVRDGSFNRDPLLGPFYTVINLLIKSDGISLDVDDKFDAINSFNDSNNPVNSRMLRDAGNDFADPTGSWPSSTSPWGVVAGIDPRFFSSGSLPNYFAGPFDLVSFDYTRASPSTIPKFSFIYGTQTQQDIIEASTPNFEVYLYECPFIQIRSYTIREEYLDESEEV